MGAGASTPTTLQEEAVQLVNTARTTGGVERANALYKLANYAEKEEYKEPLCHPSLNLLPILKQILETDTHSEPAIRTNACAILWYLSRNNTCCLLIASSELALIPLIFKLLRQAKIDDDYRIHLITTINNCVLDSGTHSYLLSPEFGWLSYWKEQLLQDPTYFNLYRTITNLCQQGKNETIIEVLNGKFHQIMIPKLIQAGTKPEKWENRVGGVYYWSLNFVVALSCFSIGTIAIREMNQLQFFLELMESDSLEGIRATIVVANVYGKDENNSAAKAVLVSHEASLRLLLDVLEVTIHYDENPEKVTKLRQIGFSYAIFSLRSMISALKHLSISDENKKVMIKYPMIIKLALDLLLAFMKNREPFSQFSEVAVSVAGGGGNDFDTLYQTLELLVQLAFYYNDDRILQSSFVVPGYDLIKILQEFVNLSADRNVPFESKQFALSLLARLQSKPKQKEESKETKVSGGEDVKRGNQHIMLSYSWAKNKPLVIALGKKLREMGYDVWRDEEGSSILGAISGDIVETMAEAIQHSYMVIVFVSPEYKESVNCRNEARYAQTRQQNSDLKIAYVMVDQNYHTRSSPRVVDGWLGFMVGSDLWYPLWDQSQIENTAKGLAALVGQNAKQNGNAAVILTKTPGTSSSSKMPSTSEHPRLDYARAWQCLTAEKSTDPVALKSILEDELGLFNETEYDEGIPPEYYERLCAVLKIGVQRIFRKALQLN